MSENLQKTDEQWRAELTPEQYEVLRRKGTERPFTGPLNENKASGEYRCAGCGAQTAEPAHMAGSVCFKGCVLPACARARRR